MVMRDGGIQKFAPRDEMLPLIGSIAKQVAEAPKSIAKDPDIEELKRIDAGS